MHTLIDLIDRVVIFFNIEWLDMEGLKKIFKYLFNLQTVAWPSGKALGGSSVLHAMLNVRGNKKNYNDWAKMGATGWSYNEILPYLKKMEDNVNPEYVANGMKVSIHV